MNFIILHLLVILLVISQCGVIAKRKGPKDDIKFQYPVPRRDEAIVDDYHGYKIKDPYRWMENADSEETKKFVVEQNTLTGPYLKNFPLRQKIADRLTQLWNFSRYWCPTERGDFHFYHVNVGGLQNQSVLYMQKKGSSDSTVFFDPNELSEDGTISLSKKEFSHDGSTMAYGLSSCGSDWITGYFRNVKTGKDYPEKLEKIKSSRFAWTHDNKGIFYGCYKDQKGKTDGTETKENKNHKLYYHVLGTSQENDILTVEFPDEPLFTIRACVSYCGRWLVLTTGKGSKDNLVYVSDLNALPNRKITGKLNLISVITKMEADYRYITNDGAVFLFLTNKDAPNYRLIRIDVNNPDPGNWQTLIPEHKSDVLDWAKAVNHDKLLVCYIRDVKNILELRELATGKLIFTFPLEYGTITEVSGERKFKDVFYRFSSVLSPSMVYQVDLSLSNIKPTVFREVQLPGFNPKDFQTEQVFYRGKDGTRIPMFIISKKSIVKDGNNPCMLYGYGGFNVSILPSFDLTRLLFMDNFNGIYAIANIRGGGEYGQKWHDGGRYENKQNCFDDFNAAAEFLIKKQYTKPNLLAIMGGSNGGLLVAACANQRPDLYKTAIVRVGVLDMLRFHKFTGGHHWITEYGCSDNKADFKYLIKYSPLHNIKIPNNPAIQYPNTLLITADHDDRVVPLHSLKFIATLQHVFRNNRNQKNPFLIRINTKSGHGPGRPITKMIELYTDIYCFIAKTMNLKFNAVSSQSLVKLGANVTSKQKKKKNSSQVAQVKKTSWKIKWSGFLRISSLKRCIENCFTIILNKDMAILIYPILKLPS